MKHTKKEGKSSWVLATLKDAALLALPSIYWWVLILYCILFGFVLHYEDGFQDVLEAGVETMSAVVQGLMENIYLFIVVAIISSPIVLPLLGIYYAFLLVYATFATPIEFFSGNGFYFSNLLMGLMLSAIVLTVVGAVHFKLGRFVPGLSSGYHWEVAVSSDTVVATKVEHSSIDFAWLLNILLFLARVLLVALGGWIIFVAKTTKRIVNRKENSV